MAPYNLAALEPARRASVRARRMLATHCLGRRRAQAVDRWLGVTKDEDLAFALNLALQKVEESTEEMLDPTPPGLVASLNSMEDLHPDDHSGQTPPLARNSSNRTLQSDASHSLSSSTRASFDI